MFLMAVSVTVRVAGGGAHNPGRFLRRPLLMPVVTVHGKRDDSEIRDRSPYPLNPADNGFSFKLAAFITDQEMDHHFYPVSAHVMTAPWNP